MNYFNYSAYPDVSIDIDSSESEESKKEPAEKKGKQSVVNSLRKSVYRNLSIEF
jgi:hypothetical protein